MAFDAFLKIAGIPGESTDDKFKDWIEVLSFSTGVATDASGPVSDAGAMTSGRAEHDDITIVKAIDAASPKLAEACCKGKHLSEATLTICRAAGDKTPYMEFKIKHVVVSSVRICGDKEDEQPLPTEDLTLSYGKLTWLYTKLDHKTGQSKGKVEFTWDLVADKPG